MRSSRPVMSLLLSIVVLSLAGGVAQAQSYTAKIKYWGMDQNHDGVITRDEWRGNNASFRNQDWNHDGVLSGNEVKPGAKRNQAPKPYQPPPTTPDMPVQGTQVSDQFSRLDRNNNGVIAPNEWNGTMQDFNRLDQDRNGVISSAEYRQQGVSSASDLFSGLDDNNDGYVTRNEWNNTAASFDHLDLNRDGRLTRGEFYNQRQYPLSVYQELDQNRDGQVSRSEWRSDSATFSRLDANGNGYLTEREFNAPQNNNIVQQIFQEIFRPR